MPETTGCRVAVGRERRTRELMTAEGRSVVWSSRMERIREGLVG